MTLNDLKGLKKNDKLDLLKYKFDEIDKTVMMKLSTDVSPDVKYYVARKSTDSEILYSILINPKNWGVDKIINAVFLNTDLKDTDRLKFLESKIWLLPEFLKLSSSVRNELFKFFAMPDNRVVDSFLNAVKDSTQDIPAGYTKQTLWYVSNKNQIIEIIDTITNKELILDIFDIGTVMDMLSIDEKRKLSLDNKEVFKKYTYHLTDVYFEKIVDDKLMVDTINVGDMSDSAFTALFKNKDITNKTHNIIFDYVQPNVKHISSTKINTTLSNINLDTTKTLFFMDFIKSEDMRNPSGVTASHIFAIVANPTLDKKVIKEIFDSKMGFSRYMALANLNANNTFKDDELINYISTYGDYNNDEDNFLKSFMFMLSTRKEVRLTIINKVWDYLKNTKLTKQDVERTVMGTSIPEVLDAFFSSSGNNQTVLPLDIRVKYSYEYYKNNNIPDWLTYSDDLTEEQIDEIWNIFEAPTRLENYPRNYIWAKKLKTNILYGKYKEKYGIMYFNETGDDEFLPASAKDIFLF